MAAPVQHRGSTDTARYEYRVWGRHRKARRKLARLADQRFTQVVEDCYLLVDDQLWNAKVRDDVLKLKRLVAEDKGFEAWVSARHRTAKRIPEPFEEIFEAMNLDRVAKGKSFDLRRAAEALDRELGVQAVFVTKDRVRHRVGALRADVTDLRIDGTDIVLRSLSIEGHDLDDLVALRSRLGLKGEPNIAVHEAIDSAL